MAFSAGLEELGCSWICELEVLCLGLDRGTVNGEALIAFEADSGDSKIANAVPPDVDVRILKYYSAD